MIAFDPRPDCEDFDCREGSPARQRLRAWRRKRKVTARSAGRMGGLSTTQGKGANSRGSPESENIWQQRQPAFRMVFRTAVAYEVRPEERILWKVQTNASKTVSSIGASEGALIMDMPRRRQDDLRRQHVSGPFSASIRRPAARFTARRLDNGTPWPVRPLTPARTGGRLLEWNRREMGKHETGDTIPIFC